MTLIVCSLSALPDVIAARHPSHVISILTPNQMIQAVDGVAPHNHLRLGVDDIAAPMAGLVMADESTIARLLAFARGWDGQAPMIIHCLAGVSRSTAAALSVACDRNPSVPEQQIAEAMRRAAPHAYPNRRIVALADHLLDRRGRLIEAAEAIGRDEMGLRPTPFDLPSQFSAASEPA